MISFDYNRLIALGKNGVVPNGFHKATLAYLSEGKHFRIPGSFITVGLWTPLRIIGTEDEMRVLSIPKILNENEAHGSLYILSHASKKGLT